ncbi:hypothetical protein H9L19_01340 [Weissella diestrammenae]|uniref:Uncharacterized protein n=1 Tax=Weissella diestrammenae TaxID=1162633 RepID=A0A7G9T646_9LACO|nr:hypothetical protein [Weissella diestrammenae]MCM0582409.1 hypothetical protein [Weissella diestrammenae]QNN75571.1 hypothetical protein H9L19_01340 [Weissella diestrammenae]
MKKYITIFFATVTLASSALVLIAPVLADELNAKEYTMDNGKKITIKDSDIVDTITGDPKGDRSEVYAGDDNKSLIQTADFDLVPHVDGKWDKMFHNLGDNKTAVLQSVQNIGGIYGDWHTDDKAYDANGKYVPMTGADGLSYARSLQLYGAAKQAKSSMGTVSDCVNLLAKAMNIGNVKISLPGSVLTFFSDWASLTVSGFNAKCDNIIHATDKTTDRGFGTVITYTWGDYPNKGRVYTYKDYFYNDSWDTPQVALSKPDGSDPRTPNDWPGGLNYIRKDFYGGWSCDYNKNAHWVGVGGVKNAY